MPRAPSARIQARHEHAAQDNEEVAERQVARPNRARLVNQRNPLPTPACANHRQVEEEVQQELAYDEGANYDDEEMDEDYIAEEEEESEEVEMEPENEVWQSPFKVKNLNRENRVKFKLQLKHKWKIPKHVTKMWQN